MTIYDKMTIYTVLVFDEEAETHEYECYGTDIVDALNRDPRFENKHVIKVVINSSMNRHNIGV